MTPRTPVLLPWLALAAMQATAWAQPAPPTPVASRIAALATRLAITPAEQPAWADFSAAMRANAAATERLLAQRAADTARMTAPQNMRSYAVIARLYADSTTKLADAFDRLYATLSLTQQQAADTLFRHVSQPPPRSGEHL